MENKGKRNIYYDIVRITAMFLVIGVHALGSIEQYAETGVQKAFTACLGDLNDLGVPIFFALSGVFILSKEYDDIRKFYKNRLIRIGVPYLVYAAIYVCYFTGYDERNPLGIPFAYVKDILTAGVHPTHWFVYTLMGIYFAAPFLSRMVHAVNDRELMLLFGGCLFINIACRMFSYFGMSFGIDNVIFNTGNLWLFFAGYSSYRLIKKSLFLTKYHLLFSAVAVLIYLLTHEILFGQAAVMLLLAEGKNPDFQGMTGSITANISKYSYSVYLIHAAVISLILKVYDNWSEYYCLKGILIYFAVFLISYLMVRVIDFLITDRIIAKL